MKKLKAFTLIELIIVIAIFGIIMGGIMQLFAPIHETATNAQVVNNQQNVENSIVEYLGSRLRYSTNLLIVQQGAQVGTINVTNAETAIDALFAFGPVNSKGRLLDSDANRYCVNVICFDGKNAYSYGNKNYYGRLVSSLETRDSSSPARSTTLNFSNTKQDGSVPQYIVFNNAYYSTSNCYLTIRLSGDNLKLWATSDYYYNKAQKKFFDDSTNPTVGTYELRNMGKKSGNNIPYVFKYAIASGSPSDSPGIVNQGNRGKANSMYYFVYTLDVESMANDPSPSPVNPTYIDGSALALPT